MSRNIVVCCDGTSNQISGYPTNVLRLWSALKQPTQSQIAFYDPGVGTLGDPTNWSMFQRRLRKKLDNAIGLSIGDNFADAYGFLAQTYQPGDRIFLFGFSRGAYTARAVAGAIHLFGLLRPEHANLTRYLWRSYSNDEGDEDAAVLFNTANRFKKRFGRAVHVHFLGVWDTVSSFGWITQFRTLPHTRKNPSVSIVRHALAIDERRACFRANMLNRASDTQDFKELWFAGVHADVGGGYPEEESALAKIPLLWMMEEAESAGLIFDPANKQDVLSDPAPDPCGVQHQSLAGWWRLLEYLPQRRFKFDKKRWGWHWPNRGRLRDMQPKGCDPPVIHESVRQRMERASYKPRNLRLNLSSSMETRP